MDGSTTESRWARIQELFDGAIEQPAHERDAWLDSACDGDSELRHDVQSLLAADATGGLRVQNMISAAAKRALVASANDSKMLGPYRLLRVIGHGGMGAVYLAERSDDEFEQRVAIKVLHKSMVAPEFLARFRKERQILADLNHPNIAHLIDGGTTDDGVPYLVMEYVEGKPINQYCDDNRLAVDQRLDLFREVCAAIELAHQNLIVHRDIKANNILVTRDGTPKLLDFGIAKSLTTQGEHDGITRLGDRILTPNNASPEQVAGKAVSTASDVYSLGVLLYELLCGVCPFDLNRCSPAEMERIVTTLEADAPSRLLAYPQDYVPRKGRTRCPSPNAVAIDRNTTLERLRRKLRGDIDNIVLKALHKDRAKRYRSVGRLSEDIQRYLRGQPVTARPDSFGYRASKFIQRNLWSVTAGTAFVISLGAFALVTSLQADRLADTNLSLDATIEFMGKIFLAADPFRATGTGGGEESGRDQAQSGLLAAVDRAAEELKRASQQNTPLEFAELQQIIGSIYYRLEEIDKARDFLRQAVATRERRLGPETPELVETFALLAELEQSADSHDLACRYANRAYDISRRRVTSPHALLALSQSVLARQIEIARFHPIAECKSNSGESTDTLYKLSLANYEQLGDETRPRAADTLRKYGLLLFRAQRYEDSIAVTEQALAIDQEIYGARHPFVAHDYENIARAVMALGDYERCEPLLERSLAIHEVRLEQYPFRKIELARSRMSMGECYEKQERFGDALNQFEASLALSQTADGVATPDVALALGGMANALAQLGRDDAAEARFLEALEAHAEANTRITIHADAVWHYGRFLLDKARYGDAQTVYAQALALLKAEQPRDWVVDGRPREWQVGVVLSDLGLLNANMGRFDAARSHLDPAVELLTSALGPAHEHTRRARERLADVPIRERSQLP